MPTRKRTKLPGKLVFVGFGSVGQGVMPLLLKHLRVTPADIMIVTADERGLEEAQRYGVKFVVNPLTRGNYRAVLEPVLKTGDFLLNVSVDVSSVALIELCQERGAFYLDTCIEPWAGGYIDTRLSPSQRSNYALREAALAVNKKYRNGPTAILTHGANPGLVSHFVKRALLDIARDTGVKVAQPATREKWALLAEKLGVKVIHIAERDTQSAVPTKRVGEFVNTWSVDGFVGEGCQPAELGWGSHEKHFPGDGRRHEFGSGCAIYLQRPGASMRVRSWTPREGPYHGFMITHGESISIADYFTVYNGDQVRYRPTVHYAYHPCDGAVTSVHELAGKNWKLQDKRRVLMDEIEEGVDELGVLLMGHAKAAYWYGSVLGVDEARKLAPYNNATSLQVSCGILGAIVWAVENPKCGVIDPDEMDFERVIEIARPYLGKLVGKYSSWTPLSERGVLFPEDVDASDPWQFKNFRVV
ncbi:MAG TPA: saccharopine dehydrogenase C-terminal domain-containing protein [Burkholderiales bacterium]|nr:saccharopine dehydrogenase C-terminal domain-containing protein [Burkholderiales bacterium]